MSSRPESGHAVIEFALLSPWLFTLFVGALNFGLIYHSLTAVQNAARAAAMYTSSSPSAINDTSGACDAALREIRMLPNIRSAVVSCSADPVLLSLDSPSGIAGELTSRVSLTYRTVPLIVMPPLPAQLNLTRTAVMRVRDE